MEIDTGTVPEETAKSSEIAVEDVAATEAEASSQEPAAVKSDAFDNFKNAATEDMDIALTIETAPSKEEVAKSVTEAAARTVVPNKVTAQAPRSQIVQRSATHGDMNNPRVRQFNFQVGEYLKICKNNAVSETALKERLGQFTNIIRAIINSNDTAVYDAAYKFFKEYRTNILAESVVFQHIHSLPTETSIRTQTVYTVFRELVRSNMDGKPYALDYGLIRDNLKLPSQHPLLNWLRRRINRK